MKHNIHIKIITFVLLFYCLIPLSIQAQNTQIEFTECSWISGLGEAQKQGKLLFVDVYNNYCPPCKLMDQKVFTNEKLATYMNQNFVNVKLNAENIDSETFIKKYGIEEMPTLLFFAPNGDLLSKSVGYQKTADLLNKAQTYVNKIRIIYAVKDPETVLQKFAHKRHQVHLQLASNDSEREKKLEETKAFLRLQQLALIYKRSTGARPAKLLHEYAYALKNHYQPYDRVVNEYLETQRKQMDKTENLAFLREFTTDANNDAIKYFIQHIDYFKMQDGGEQVNQKIRNAVYETVVTAINERYKALFDKALNTIDKANLPNNSRFTFEMQSLYYQGVEDWITYAKIAEKYIDDNDITDPKLLNKIAKNFHSYVHDKKMLKAAIKWAETATKIESDYNSYHNLAALHYKLGEYKKALKVGEKAIEIGRLRNLPYSATLKLLDNIKSRNFK